MPFMRISDSNIAKVKGASSAETLSGQVIRVGSAIGQCRCKTAPHTKEYLERRLGQTNEEDGYKACQTRLRPILVPLVSFYGGFSESLPPAYFKSQAIISIDILYFFQPGRLQKSIRVRLCMLQISDDTTEMKSDLDVFIPYFRD